MELLNAVGRIALCVVFAVSAFGKLRGRAARRDFRRSLRDMRLLPSRLVATVAGVVAAGEAAAALALPWPASAAYGLPAAAALVALFTAVLITVRWRRLDVACPCFGTTRSPVGPGHIVRNLLLITIAVAALQGPNVDLWRLPTVPGAVLAWTAGLVCGLVLVHTDELISLFTDPMPGEPARAGSANSMAR